MSDAPDFSVVVMAYNEAPSLEGMVREMETVLSGLRRPYELLIVDDGSSDGTGPLADSIAAVDHRVRVLHHGGNRGLGGVYRSGFDAARGRYVTFFPADGQFPASILERFAPLIEDHDMVLGYLPRRLDAWPGRVLSWSERLLYRLLFGPMPRFQGVLLFRREVLGRFPPRARGRGWVVLMELIVRAQRAGCRLVSVPTEMRRRERGASKVNNWATVFSNLAQMVGLWRLL